MIGEDFSPSIPTIKASPKSSKSLVSVEDSKKKNSKKIGKVNPSLKAHKVSDFDVSEMCILKTQCGGHKGMRQGNTLGRSPSIAKPMHTEREADFYKKIIKTPLYQCLPKFFGVSSDNNNISSSPANDDNVKWLFLQDLTAGMTSPCIADLKIGTRTYEVGVPKWKSDRQKSLLEGTTTMSHAVRCIDICTRKDGEIICHWDRKEGRKMSWLDLEKVLKVFLGDSKQSNISNYQNYSNFDSSDSSDNSDNFGNFNENIDSKSNNNMINSSYSHKLDSRTEQLLKQLKSLREKLIETLRILPNIRLYSASVLVIYDGDNENIPLVLKLIDFGHGYIDLAAEGGDINDPSYDDNALLGINNLIKSVRAFAKEYR